MRFPRSFAISKIRLQYWKRKRQTRKQQCGEEDLTMSIWTFLSSPTTRCNIHSSFYNRLTTQWAVRRRSKSKFSLLHSLCCYWKKVGMIGVGKNCFSMAGLFFEMSMRSRQGEVCGWVWLLRLLVLLSCKWPERQSLHSELLNSSTKVHPTPNLDYLTQGPSSSLSSYLLITSQTLQSKANLSMSCFIFGNNEMRIIFSRRSSVSKRREVPCIELT